MSHKSDLVDRRRAFPDIREELGTKFRRTHENMTTKSGQVETEKRKRREVANCNERRRMQSINTGFENLRELLPPIQDGEKLSKATILQLTVKFINTLMLKMSSLEKEVAVYRQSFLNSGCVLADITDKVSTGFSRKRRSEDHGKLFDTSSKCTKQNDPESALLDLDDGNTSGRSSECYDNHFVCSPSSGVHQVANIVSDASTESTTSTAARLEHLVMAIEQIEGNTLIGNCEKTEALTDAYGYDYHSHAPCYKFSDSVTSGLRQFTYGLHTTDSSLLKPNITSFTEEFMLNSLSSELPSNLVPVDVCEDKNLKPVSIDEYPPAAKLLNRPIPHKYLHRPQVVVDNSH